MSHCNKLAHLPKPVYWWLVVILCIILFILTFRLVEIEFRDGYCRLRFGDAVKSINAFGQSGSNQNKSKP